MSWFEEAKKIAAATVLVMEHVDQPTAQARMDVCDTCEWNDRASKKCSICGCFLENKVWSKISRSKPRPLGELTHCPRGKWNDKDIADHYRALDGIAPLDAPAPDSTDNDDLFFY